MEHKVPTYLKDGKYLFLDLMEPVPAIGAVCPRASPQSPSDVHGILCFYRLLVAHLLVLHNRLPFPKGVTFLIPAKPRIESLH